MLKMIGIVIALTLAFAGGFLLLRSTDHYDPCKIVTTKIRSDGNDQPETWYLNGDGLMVEVVTADGTILREEKCPD